MERLAWALSLFLIGSCLLSAGQEESARARNHELNLTSGWRVTQDVRQLGEQSGWYKPDFPADWQQIDRLVHLQLLLAPQPYFGRNLRYFNDAPWWYRTEFSTAEISSLATLRFEGVDYFAKVWLNGTFLGEHEGYADQFDFEVGKLLRKDKPNVLVVEVSSPWDHRYAMSKEPVFSVVRNLLKGSYEHADTFVQRDVNPIGIWRPVKLFFHDELRETDSPNVTTSLSSDQQKATVKVAWTVFNDGPPTDVDYVVRVRLDDTEKDAATNTRSVRLHEGANILEQTVVISTPRLWTTWDRGNQPLYKATVEIAHAGNSKLSSSTEFGVRTIELHRTATEVRFFIDGKPLYLRGATYWPDLYLSKMNRARYDRDIQTAIRAGINAFRVHVHTENPDFYEICDRAGILVIQDNDLNWTFPTDSDFNTRTVQHFGTIIKLLRNHPSVIAWIAMNEVFWGQKGFEELTGGPKISDVKSLGAQLTAEANRLDPTRPVIENSGISNDLASGDVHDYRGSLSGGKSTYFDIYGTPEDMFGSQPDLVTEFGVDAPPAVSSLAAIPEAAARLSDVLPHVAELHDYQYRLLKYYIEHYRIHKYSPNAGYFQFMWIDFSPQSFYGVYDYWGVPKTEGLGGGLRAMTESNQPIGIFMEHTTKPLGLYVANDSLTDLGNCVAHWRVTSSEGGVVAEDSQSVAIRPDSGQKIRDFTFAMKEGETYNVELDLSSADGKVLAHNIYVNPFQPQPRPKGYPDRMDDELGMRLWWAGETK
jgi:beta-mannosidase